jgi:hypothetical protein
MSRRNTAFRQQIGKFVKLVERNSEQAARVAGANLLRSVVLDSPVDSGRFRGNWGIQFEASPEQQVTVDKGGIATIQRGINRLKYFKLGMPRIYILNHLPYSIELEYGHSKQAPSPPGIVRLAVQRFDSLMRRAAAYKEWGW